MKGDLSLGVPGLSVVIDPKNLSNTTVDLGFGTATVEQTREGCDITVTVTMFGKIVNQDTRKADNCSEPEPTPTPTPTPTPPPKPPDPGEYSPKIPPKSGNPPRLNDTGTKPGWVILELPGRISYQWNGSFIVGVYLQGEDSSFWDHVPEYKAFLQGIPSTSYYDTSWELDIKVSNTQLLIGATETTYLPTVPKNSPKWVTMEALRSVQQRIKDRKTDNTLEDLSNKKISKISQPSIIKGSGQTSGYSAGLDANFIDYFKDNNIVNLNDNFIDFTFMDFLATSQGDILDWSIFNYSTKFFYYNIMGTTYKAVYKGDGIILLGTSNLQDLLERIETIPEINAPIQHDYTQRQWRNNTKEPVLGRVTDFYTKPRIVQTIELKYRNIPNKKTEFETPPRSIPPIMDNECCDLIEDIYDMLGGDNFKENGLEIPNHLYIPGGKGETKGMTYNALMNLVFRTLDHRTCGEVEIAVKDNNPMKEGEQGYTFKAINNTAAIGKIMELSQKQDSDISALLNLIIRLNWIAVQILKVSIIASESAKAIIGFFGIPTRDKIESVEIPVDPSLGGKVGFDPKKPTDDQLIKLLDLDDPEKTIKILDKFMNYSKIPVTIRKFIGDAKGGNFWWMMDKKGK
ncbi:hypothetical protein [Planktothrix sp. PCC 11201]|uniref:hypothetical protein n=1 Tax=Planktothrix sp. PCC 11201 TaxID=1729650 RepID=UPI00117F372E|nr:hypothetical protein [Planktothrix sp. PCC 11201]